MNASDRYSTLAIKIIQHLSEKSEFQKACTSLMISKTQQTGWMKGKVPVRLPVLLSLLKKMGVSSEHILAMIMAPRSLRLQKNLRTEREFESKLIAPLLKELRRDFSLQEVSKILKLKSHSTYGHWEKARRSISLTDFLRVIDLLALRLPAFCEVIGFNEDLPDSGWASYVSRANFSSLFFKLPWTPTVYLALVTGILKINSWEKDLQFLKVLGLSAKQVEESLRTLFDLRLIAVDRNKLNLRKEYFYLPPNLNPEVLNSINNYWFSMALPLTQIPGYHKIDQCTMSKELFDDVVIWVSELRDKIKKAALQEKPEKVIHIHWQIADLLATKPGYE